MYEHSQGLLRYSCQKFVKFFLIIKSLLKSSGASGGLNLDGMQLLEYAENR
ncbi:hypothetical protein VU12_06255 [Desulfobulbus sp. US4]|nr:hypothetical protein [Desulfobulbus sp. US4]